MKTQVLFVPVRELSELVRTRQVRPVELAELYLDRLERVGPRYNAVVTVMRPVPGAGLDTAQFSACYSSDKYQAEVDKDFQDAQDAGITGTPYFVLTYTKAGGEAAAAQPIEGAQPFDVFKQAIDAALADSAQ